MRTRTKVILLALLLGVAGAVLLIPRFLSVDRVRQEITRQLSEHLGGAVEIESVRWHWLPLPHLSLYNAHLRYEEVDLTAPESRLYPNWLSAFLREPELGKVVLKNPDITVRLNGNLDTRPLPELRLPRLRLAIDNGSLRLVSTGPIQGIATNELKLTALSASIKVAPEAATLQLKAKSSFSKSLMFRGRYDFARHTYTLDTEWEEFRLHEAVTSFADGKVVPVESTANIKGKIKGSGMDTISAELYGEMPCFLVKPKDKKVLIDCGFADLLFEKKGDNLQLHIKDLELKTPGLRLRGTINRASPDKESEPVWSIDLAGSDLDVTQIRTTVLTLFGTDEIVQDICEIVRGGTAKSATYTFTGRAADFEYLSNQVITAEAANVSLFIPEIDLRLDEASGQMIIKDGFLTLSGASARLGQSRGKNCSLTLGLLDEHHNPVFKLDLDIDAEAGDLMQVLFNLVHYEPFQKELFHFSHLKGKGSGHLSIGDTLNDLNVTVTVSGMEVMGRYDRLSAPFHAHRGTLRIDPHRVSWSGIQGTVGDHRILDLAGSVDWHKEPRLRIERFSADLDGETLLNGLNYYPALAEHLAPLISKLSGAIKLTNGTLEGPPLEFEKWRYTAALTLQNVAWQSPLLGPEITGQQGRVQMSDQQIQLIDNKGRFLKSALEVKGIFNHTVLGSWHGWVEFAGSLDKELGGWLKEQQWLPGRFLPKLPGKIKGLRLDWDENSFAASGSFMAGGISLKRPPEFTFRFKSSDLNPLVVSLGFMDQERKAQLDLDLLDRIPETFRFAWQGELRAQTMKRLFTDSALLNGHLEGNCEVVMPPLPQQPRFNGQLAGTELLWPWEAQSLMPLSIKAFRVHGANGITAIEQLLLSLNAEEQLAITGTVNSLPQGVRLGLNLSSPHLTRKTALDFLNDLKSLRAKAGAADADSEKPPALEVTGTVHFKLDEFISGPKETGAEPASASTLAWKPLKGVVTLQPHGKMIADIESGMLCCMNTKGTWYSDPQMGVSHFTIDTACPEPPKFEEVLPCVGIKQNVVEGNFTLAADLYGNLDHWQSGKAVISSAKGRILRMKFLSKVFSVVNLTDIFTSDGFPKFDEKGFAYSELILETSIKDNELIIDKAIVRGEGLNLFARGKLHLDTYQADITVLIAPFKTLDTLVAKVPLVGRAIGGKEAAIITIPVGVKGDIRDPTVTVLAPGAVGEGLLNIVTNTLLLPFNILSPILPGSKEEAGKP